MKKREAAMQVIFKHWIQAKWSRGTAVFELKRTTTDRFYIRDIKEHQIAALVQARHGIQYYKIPDDSIGEKPYDCYVMQGAQAFVVIGFGAKLVGFYLIPIEVWIRNTQGAVSVTEDQVMLWKSVEYIAIPKKP